MPLKSKTDRRYPLLALFAGILAAAGCLALFAFALVHWELSQSVVPAMAFSALAIGSALGAGLMARLRGSGGLSCGFITGTVYSAILLLWNIFCNGSILAVSPFYLGCIFLFSCVGGYGGMLLAEKRSKHHR